MKAVVAAFNQEKALVGAFPVIVQPVVEPMDRFAALVRGVHVQSVVVSRLLELEQRESRERSPVTVEAGDLDTADTKAEDRDKDSGCSGSLASLEDLLETQADFRVSI